MNILFIILLLVLIAAVILTMWLAFRLFVQHGQLVLRMEAVEQKLADGVPPSPDVAPEAPAASDPLEPNVVTVAEDGTPVVSMTEGILPGTRAPSFRIPDIGGSELSLEKYPGQEILLVFTDPYCEPCDRLLPRLKEAAARQSEVQVILISRGDALVNQRKVDEFGLTFPVGLQRQWEVSRAYGMVAAPIAFLIDTKGTIAEIVAVGEDEVMNLFDRAAASPLDRG